MPEICVSDTGPILHLAEIDRVTCLTCLDAIVVSPQVKAEMRQHSVDEVVFKVLDDRIHVEHVTQSEINVQQRRFQGYSLHTSDLSVAALAERLKPAIVLTDDLRLRKALETQGHKVVGSVGIVMRAFTDGIIDNAELRTAIGELLDGSSLYTSSAFREHVYRIVDAIEQSPSI